MKLFKVIVAGLLIVLVMISSTNFLVGIHFCMGDIQKVSLFSEASGCEMQKTIVPPCHKHLQEPCCDDETVIHESDEFNASQNELSVFGQDVVQNSASPVLIALVVPETSPQHSPIIYDPPLRSPDIVIEHRTFLI